MILVTGAAGKTGRAVIAALVRRGAASRALVRREAYLDDLIALGARDAVVGDFLDAASLDRACRGARVIYHICPNVSADEIVIGAAIVAAAQRAGVERVVFHSVLHPQTLLMPHHWNKLRVEEMLFESGLRYTILQPASYMQNLLAGWRRIVEHGVYTVPYPTSTKLGLVDLDDVAEAAASVLTEAGHDAATNELGGPEVHTQDEIAGILGDALGRPVHAEAVSVSVWTTSARAAGLQAYQIRALRKMFAYYARVGFWGNSRVLSALIGRAPTTLHAFIKRTVARLP